MSEPENFLTRWSRRKLDAERVAEEPSRAPSEPATGDEPDAAAGTHRSPSAEADAGEATPAFDPASLPPVETIDHATDIRDFLKTGVPAELTRAALQRAWTSDPAIRDFIGIAENQWDFTNSSIPGFGGLEATDDLRRIALEVMDAGRPASPEQANEPAREAEGAAAESDRAIEPPVRTAGSHEPEAATAAHAEDEPGRNTGEERDAADGQRIDVAMQHDTTDEADRSVPVKRAHGRALPE